MNSLEEARSERDAHYRLLRDAVLDPSSSPIDAELRVAKLWSRAHYVYLYRETTNLHRIVYAALVDDLVEHIDAYTAQPPAATDPYVYRLFFSRGPTFTNLVSITTVKHLTIEQRFRILAAVSGNPSVVSILDAGDRECLEEYHATVRAALTPFVRKLDKIAIARGTPGIAAVILPTDSVDGVLDALEDQSRNPGDFDFGDCKRQRL